MPHIDTSICLSSVRRGSTSSSPPPFTSHKQLQLTCTIPLDSGPAGLTYNRVHHRICTTHLITYLARIHTWGHRGQQILSQTS
ncbi:hypothetical protein CGRA01v4_11200 [Colletotrichum graminicola]|nr:hypothetical protein CGRA01v4_11200 [Colletotrichum graminicola]